LGPIRLVINGKRVYTVHDAQNFVSVLNRRAELRGGGQLAFGQARHRKKRLEQEYPFEGPPVLAAPCYTYPTDPEMSTAWAAGIQLAREALSEDGMEPENSADVVWWMRPWSVIATGDVENGMRDVGDDGFDENEADDDGADDGDDDDAGDADTDGDDDDAGDDDDGLRLRGGRGALGEADLLETVLNGPPEVRREGLILTGKERRALFGKVSVTFQGAEGKRVNKANAVAMKNTSYTQLSSDRSIRVMQSGRAASKPSAVIDDQYKVGLTDDVGIALKYGVDATHLAWRCGKVQAIWDYKYDPPLALVKPLNLLDGLKEVYVLVKWYAAKVIDGSTNLFIYTYVQDPQLISLEHVLMPVSLVYEARRNVYAMSDGVRDLLVERLNSLTDGDIGGWGSIFGVIPEIPAGPIKRRGFKNKQVWAEVGRGRQPKGPVDEDLDGGVVETHSLAMMPLLVKGTCFSVEVRDELHPCILAFLSKDEVAHTVKGQWLALADGEQDRSGRWTYWLKPATNKPSVKTLPATAVLSVFKYTAGDLIGADVIEAMDALAETRV
jgi:hypothetical protein